MKIGLIGGTGSISKFLPPILLEDGHEVVVYNRGQSAETPPGVRQITGDRSDRAAFEAAMQAERFDAVVDFISFSAEDAASSLRAFRGVGRFVHISSCVVYGLDFLWTPVTEDHPWPEPGNYANDYARGKAAAERLIQAAIVGERLPATVVRFGATFGGYTGPRRQVTGQLAWLDRIPKGRPIVIGDAGRALIQCLHSADACRAVAGLLVSPRAVGQSYNVLHPEPVTWAEHHRTVMAVLGREVELVGVPYDTLAGLAIPRGDCFAGNFGHSQHVATARLQRDLPDWRPQVSLYAMLDETIETLRRQGVIPDCDAAEFAWEDRLISAQRAVGQLRF